MLMMASGLTYFDKFTYHEREIRFYQEETKFVIFCLLQTFPNEGTLTLVYWWTLYFYMLGVSIYHFRGVGSI